MQIAHDVMQDLWIMLIEFLLVGIILKVLGKILHTFFKPLLVRFGIIQLNQPACLIDNEMDVQQYILNQVQERIAATATRQEDLMEILNSLRYDLQARSPQNSREEKLSEKFDPDDLC